MNSLAAGWRIQRRVIGALMVRELVTRFGRENIGFLWVMVEPLLFAVLVGVIWRYIKGPEEHGVSIIAFVATGYLPLVFFRNSVNRAVRIFSANSGLMYHRQVKVLDFVFVRVLIEMLGALMAYVFIGVILIAIGEFPIPADIGIWVVGWFLYSLFTFAACTVLAPLSEMSDVLEKLVPVTTYIMIPFAGTFNMTSWLALKAQQAVYYSPFVHPMEMMRYGVFGESVGAKWDITVPVAASLIFLLIGLALCRRVRRDLVVE